MVDDHIKKYSQSNAKFEGRQKTKKIRIQILDKAKANGNSRQDQLKLDDEHPGSLASAPSQGSSFLKKIG